MSGKQLKIIYVDPDSGTTLTIDLQAAGFKVLDPWYPETPGEGAASVTEKIPLSLKSSTTKAYLQGMILELNAAFAQAVKHPDDLYRVYLQLGVADDYGTTHLWRSRIIRGKLLYNAKIFKNWDTKRADVDLIVERDPFWEGEEAQVTTSNHTGSDTGDGSWVNGLQIYNPTVHRKANTISFDAASKEIRDSGNGLHDFKTGDTIVVEGSASNDGTYTIHYGELAALFIVHETLVDEAAGNTVGIDGAVCNYLNISSGVLEGDLPGPARLEIYNDYNSAVRAYTVWVAQNMDSDFKNFEHILSAEAATGETTTVDPGSVGCAYKLCEWSGATETTLLTWTLSTALLDAARGNYHRILARFADEPDEAIWVRFKVVFGVTTLWEGPLVQLNTADSIQEIASMRLPPYLLGASGVYPLDLVFSAQHSGGGAHHLLLDYLQLTPLEGWRKLVPKGYGVGYQARLVDDGIDGYLYTDGWATAGKTGHYVGYGAPILLGAQRSQRLIFLHSANSGVVEIARTLSVKVFYRPRRIVL